MFLPTPARGAPRGPGSRAGAAHEQAGVERPPGHLDVGDARRGEGVEVVLDAGKRVVVVVLAPVGRGAELLARRPQTLVPHVAGPARGGRPRLAGRPDVVEVDQPAAR